MLRTTTIGNGSANETLSTEERLKRLALDLMKLKRILKAAKAQSAESCPSFEQILYTAITSPNLQEERKELAEIALRNLKHYILRSDA
jgi:hypothetical protein